MLDNGERLFAYPYKGYWKDVGTINSLWDANMELYTITPVLTSTTTRGVFSRET